MRHTPITDVAGTTRRQKTFKAIALLLVFCVADVYVIAGNRVTHSEVARHLARKANTSARETATNISGNKMLLGRLIVPHHREILVNGHTAMSGEIIISGAHLQNPNAAIPATVDIGSIARLDIEPGTDLLLTFDQKSVEVKVAAGNATLSTVEGVKGQVIMPDGEVCAGMPSPDPQCKRPPYKRPEIYVPVLIGGVIIIVLILIDRGQCVALVSPAMPCEVVP